MKTYCSLTIAEKKEIIEAVIDGYKKKSVIAEQFEIPQSTLSTILKDKNKILSNTSRETKRKRE